MSSIDPPVLEEPTKERMNPRTMSPILTGNTWEKQFSEGNRTKKVKKILITSDLYLPSVNGVVTSITNLVGELRKRNYDVRILATSNDTHYHYDEAEQVYYMQSIPFNIYPGVRMPLNYVRHEYLEELTEWKPDIIHSQCEFFSFEYAKKIAKRTNAPIIHTYHTLYGQYASYLPFSSVIANTEKMIGMVSQMRLNDVNTVIAPTKKVKDALLAYGLKNRIVVIPTGIAMEKFRVSVSEEIIAALRLQYGITPEDKVLLSLGRIGKEKNIEELIRYYAALSDQRDDVKFMIVGGGPDSQRLIEIAESYKLKNKVIFTGMVKPELVRQYYALADIFVCASTSETQGLTYVEALACGVPLVCRADAALDSVLIQGTNGFCYHNSTEFCSYISRILDDPMLSAAMRKENLIRSNQFSKEQFAENILELYDAVFEEGSPPPPIL